MVDKTTGGNQAPNLGQDEGNASEKYVTAEQVAQIVNAAITARNRQFETKLESQFSELKSILQPKEESDAPSKGKRITPEMEAMQNQLKQLQQERAKSRDMNLRNSVREKLMKAGVNPSHIKALVALHVDADKNISYASEDSDEVLFKTSDSHYTLDQGLDNWLKGPDAKIYLNPKGASGSGDKKYQNNNFSGKSSNPREDAGRMLTQALLGGGLPTSSDDDDF